MNYKKIVNEVIKNWSNFAESLTFLQNKNRDAITINDFISIQHYIMKNYDITTAEKNELFWDEFKNSTTTNACVENMVRVVMQVMFDWWFIVEGVSDFAPPDFDRNKITFKEFTKVQDYISKEKGINTDEKREEFWDNFKKITANTIYF